MKINKFNPIIKTNQLKIRFGDFVANQNINLSVYAGQIQSIVGENGAGKSTLMKMLYGTYKPTSGEILVDRERVHMTPQIAMRLGIGMVFQDFRIIPAFTAFENIMMALPKEKRKRPKEEIKKEICEISQKYKIPVDPDMLVGQMDLGQRQRVEIIKVLMMGKMRVLIFDEPTSVLTQQEAQEFIKMLQSMRDDGYAILLITHKLHEVMACSDVITVLRHGEIVEKEEKENGYDQERLISKMMGGEVTIHTDYEDQKKVFEKEEVLLEGKDMSIYNAQHRELIRHGNLTMKAGEIIGLAGISGRGQRELLETLFGVNVLKMGQLTIDGKDMTKSSIRDRIEAGMALVSEDPKRDNVVAEMKIYEHFALNGPEISYKKVGINWKDLTDKMDTSKAVKELGVPEKTRELATLSGGNIQRCMLARAVMKQPKILLASYPSRGLDVGTVEMVHQTLVELRNQGCSILLVSEDLEELLSVSDSIVVISGDTLTEKLDPKTTSALEIGDLMIGGKGGNAYFLYLDFSVYYRELVVRIIILGFQRLRRRIFRKRQPR